MRLRVIIENSWLQSLFSDQLVSDLLSDNQQLRMMLDVEAAYTEALLATGVVNPQTATPVLELLKNPKLDIAGLQTGAEIDGLVVPSLIRQLKAQLPKDNHSALHSGLTSQDVIDTAFALTVRPILDSFETRLDSLSYALDELNKSQGAHPMMGRTRMQAAVPVTASDRIVTWRQPLLDHIGRLANLRPALQVLSFGGPVGVQKPDKLAKHMATTLHLELPWKAPHSMRAHQTELAHWLSLVTGSLGKMGQDIALMAQQCVGDIQLKNGGSSSAMPHKSNPVKAEILVALARFNATQVSGLHHALIHEQERSGAAWALEWILLPQMLQATGAALNAAGDITDAIVRIGANGEG
jgi:3-carboxy-cis,cis-muconate cycloisomerase